MQKGVHSLQCYALQKNQRLIHGKYNPISLKVNMQTINRDHSMWSTPGYSKVVLTSHLIADVKMYVCASCYKNSNNIIQSFIFDIDFRAHVF